MPLSADEMTGTIYEKAVPARAPFSGLSALSQLGEELTEVNKLAAKTLIDNKSGFNRLLSFFRQSKLPTRLEGFAVRLRKLAQRSQGENLFFDGDGMPLSMGRVDTTYETLLRPLVNLSYILTNGALNPPRQVNKEMMTLVICKLANVLHDLGEGLRSDLSNQPYLRTLHTVSRLEHAQEAWRRAAEA